MVPCWWLTGAPARQPQTRASTPGEQRGVAHSVRSLFVLHTAEGYRGKWPLPRTRHTDGMGAATFAASHGKA